MAHCTGCGLWLRESEPFCGICGLKRAVGVAGDRPEPDLTEALAPLSTDASGESRTGIDVTPTPTQTHWLDWGRNAQEMGWRPVLDYVAPAVLWALLVFVLGAMLDGITGYIGAALGTLGIAAGIRAFYAWTGNRGFMSPWLFALAALIAFLSAAGQTTRQNDTTATRAAQRGTSTSTATVTPTAQAKRLGTGGSTGDVSATDEIQTCVNAFMLNIRSLRPAQRAFSLPDSTIFANRYCQEAVRAGLFRGASTSNNRQAISALQAKVIQQLVAGGKIKLLPP
jgi:hypothetical protein